MSRSKNAKRGILSGLVNNFLNLFLPFVNRTIILYLLGVEYLGIGTLFSSLLQILNISELGFGSAIAFILYKPVAEDDTVKVCAILSFARRVFLFVGLAVLTLGIICMPFLNTLISGRVPGNLNIYLLYFLYLTNSSASYFLFSYKRILLSATQRYDLETAIGSAILIIQNILQFIVLLIWKDYYLYVIVMLISTIVSNLLCDSLTRKKFPTYYCKGIITTSDKKEIVKTVKGVFFSRLGSVLLSSVNNIVISSFLGLLVLGQFSNYYYVSTCVVGFFAVIHNSLRPVLGNCFITETRNKMFDYLKNVTLLYNWLASFCACCMLCLYQDFISIWAGEANLFPLHFVTLLVCSFYIGRICCVPSVFVEAAGLYYETRFVYLAAGVLNLVLNLILIRIIGIEGVLIAGIVANLLVCLGGYAFVLFNRFFKNRILVHNYIRTLLGEAFVHFCIIFIVYTVSSYIPSNNILQLILKTTFTAVMFGALAFLYISINRSAFVESISYVKTFIK